MRRGSTPGLRRPADRRSWLGTPISGLRRRSVGALMGALDEGWDVVGPQFVLAGLLFPPADLQTPGEQLNRWLASRSRSFWKRQLRRELARWRAVWDATGPVPVPTLSGALLAFRRETFERVGALGRGVLPLFRGNRLAAPGLPRWPADWRRSRGRASNTCGGMWRIRSQQALTSRTPAAASFRRITVGADALQAGSWACARRCDPLPLPDDPVALPPGVRWWLLSPTALGVPAAGFSGLATGFLASLNALAATQRRPARYVVFTADPDGRDVAGPWWWEARRG